jgi:NADP-reducing hydrogenase subunit HndB
MRKINSEEELLKFKEYAMSKINVREAQGKTIVRIGMGTCGIMSGAREVMRTIIDELSARNMNDVIVTQTGCFGMCKFEPMVEVIRPDTPKIMYGNVNEGRARQIVAGHVINGQVIDDWALFRQ